MRKYIKLIALCLLIIFWCACDAQNINYIPAVNANPEIKEVITSYVPNRITRNIIQDKKGNIWIASWDGIFRYDGKSFTNITKDISSARFFDVLEDIKGNFWFSTVGSGVYYYDGKSFQNFTSYSTGLDFTNKQGLGNNRVSCIYEDKRGNVWFGTDSGVSRYDGKSFQLFTTNDGLPENKVTSIVEDKEGKLWFATGNNTCLYDGEKFTVIKDKDGNNLKSLSIIKDKKGNIWLGGKDGLWRYDGTIFINLSQKFIGHVTEDKKGNIWTTEQKDTGQGFALTVFDATSLFTKKTKITTEGLPISMFGILEDKDGNIWIGGNDGIYRYDGNTVTHF
jgi:ligand-binding sensor domain-containing protein